MLDDKGYFYIIDAILAVILLLIAFLVVNTVISIPNPDYSYEAHDIKTAQDTMEILSGKVNFTDQSFLAEISQILENGENSQESIREVSKLCRDRLNSINVKNYKFCENNVLKGKILASSGDYSESGDISVATRNYGDYSYSLSVW